MAVNIPFRVGQGFDVHALVPERPLIIGGVTIPHTHGLQGHSDADVLLHAVTDAILGGAALGDIGRHFPDTDAAYRGADSRVLLRHAVAKVRAAGWIVVNVDATVHAQAPKIGPHAAAMVRNIAADLQVEDSVVNIKAKTNEGLGYLGRKEGIAATVVALLARDDRPSN
jgi:2-C-methyl-D-erythritol 2,4-cyclodiphosphate synthase